MKMITLYMGLMGCLFCLGCSGRTPNPVLSYMPGDGALGCEDLRIEMAQIKREIAIKDTKAKERDARNNGLFGLGFLVYPLFEIDTLKAEEIEIQALNARYNNMFMIAVEKECPLGNNQATVRRSGGRAPTANDILKDELPPRFEPLAALSQ
jgi:hypothetical protein